MRWEKKPWKSYCQRNFIFLGLNNFICVLSIKNMTTGFVIFFVLCDFRNDQDRQHLSVLLLTRNCKIFACGVFYHVFLNDIIHKYFTPLASWQYLRFVASRYRIFQYLKLPFKLVKNHNNKKINLFCKYK